MEVGPQQKLLLADGRDISEALSLSPILAIRFGAKEESSRALLVCAGRRSALATCADFSFSSREIIWRAPAHTLAHRAKRERELARS